MTKKLVEVMCFDKSDKSIYAHVLSTSTIKKYAGIKQIAKLANDTYAQAQLDSAIIDDMKQFAKDYAEAYGIIIDHIRIIDEYSNTVTKYKI